MALDKKIANKKINLLITNIKVKHAEKVMVYLGKIQKESETD